ncbi:MAG: TolC family protein, partial [Chitinophagaceae bacterium]|nr:TolC family protein [Chitinophagaceae bacterium]
AIAQNPAGRNASTYHSNLDTVKQVDIRERLVQLALQNPNYEIADRKVTIAERNLKKAKGSWLSAFSAAGNLNELSIKELNSSSNPNNPNNLNGGLFFPRYNFSLTLPFDFFSARSNDVKVARENMYIAEAEKNERYRTIRRDVLTRYEDFLMHKEKFDLHTRITQGEYTEYKLAEKDFADGTITAEAFKKVEVGYYNQLIAKAEAQRNFNVAKYELELLIGVNIDDVLPRK